MANAKSGIRNPNPERKGNQKIQACSSRSLLSAGRCCPMKFDN
jgi:hypothetical protein